MKPDDLSMSSADKSSEVADISSDRTKWQGPVRDVASSWQDDPLVSWLMTRLHLPNAEMTFLAELCERLIGDGVPVGRAFCGLLSLHPLFVSRQLVWRAETGTEFFTRDHDAIGSEFYLKSPVYLIHQGASAVRRRLDQPDDDLEFEIWREQRAEGMTDYIALPMKHSTGQVNIISFSTAAPGGFTVDHLARLEEILPLLTLRFELANAYNMTQSVMTTYLGKAAARRVLAGTIRRAETEEIEAAIFYCDLRGFTAMSDRMTGDGIVALLDDYFDCVINPIFDQGGEVMKFIGDGLLAMFPMQGPDHDTAAGRALTAAETALHNLDALSATRVANGASKLSAGIALHVGRVMFGNIGAADRLDFTVIGRAVNEVSRVEALTRTLDVDILTTENFRAHGPGKPLRSLGFQVLPGVKEPQELFTPEE